jgi:hypothetical protein
MAFGDRTDFFNKTFTVHFGQSDKSAADDA